jgi:predicted RNase H-like HicB family nuclease
MKGIKALKCYISKEMPPLHILFTEEDDVVVVRCLDFSISSHGQTIEEAKESINDAIIEYIEYAITNKSIDNLFDPDLKEYWELYRDLEIKLEKENFTRNSEKIKRCILEKKLTYA